MLLSLSKEIFSLTCTVLLQFQQHQNSKKLLKEYNYTLAYSINEKTIFRMRNLI